MNVRHRDSNRNHLRFSDLLLAEGQTSTYCDRRTIHRWLRDIRRHPFDLQELCYSVCREQGRYSVLSADRIRVRVAGGTLTIADRADLVVSGPSGICLATATTSTSPYAWRRLAFMAACWQHTHQLSLKSARLIVVSPVTVDVAEREWTTSVSIPEEHRVLMDYIETIALRVHHGLEGSN